MLPTDLEPAYEYASELARQVLPDLTFSYASFALCALDGVLKLPSLAGEIGRPVLSEGLQWPLLCCGGLGGGGLEEEG